MHIFCDPKKYFGILLFKLLLSIGYIYIVQLH